MPQGDRERGERACAKCGREFPNVATRNRIVCEDCDPFHDSPPPEQRLPTADEVRGILKPAPSPEERGPWCSVCARHTDHYTEQHPLPATPPEQQETSERVEPEIWILRRLDCPGSAPIIVDPERAEQMREDHADDADVSIEPFVPASALAQERKRRQRAEEELERVKGERA